MASQAFPNIAKTVQGFAKPFLPKAPSPAKGVPFQGSRTAKGPAPTPRTSARAAAPAQTRLPATPAFNLRANPVKAPMGLPPSPKLTPSQNAAEQQRGVTPGQHQDFWDRLTGAFSSTLEHPQTNPLPGVRPQGKVPGWAVPAVAAASPQGPTNIGKAIGRKVAATGLALATHPVGTVEHTVTSIPSTLNSMVFGTGRLVGTALSGHPGRAMSEVADSFRSDIRNRYGHSISSDANRMSQQGILPEILDATVVGSGPVAAGGRVASKLAAGSKFGAEDLAKVSRYRDALVKAHQHPDVAGFVARKDFKAENIPGAVKPSRGERTRAAVAESVGPRPSLRQAPGDQTPRIAREAPLRAQPRSPNLFRGLTQTAIDNQRRAAQVSRLQRVTRAKIQGDTQAAFGKPTHTYAAQLDTIAKRGEVVPVLQRGAFPGSRSWLAQFGGASKGQRMDTAYTKSRGLRNFSGMATQIEHESRQAVKQLSDPQKKVLVLAKEGMLPTHSPERAVQWLKEVRDQAHAGSTDAAGKSLIPWSQRMAGMDVARQAQAVLDHVDKHGAQDVFTPQLHQAVHHIPDERMTARIDPRLTQNHQIADKAYARRYLPQMNLLDNWAVRHPDHPLAAGTAQNVREVHQLLEQGHDLRAQAIQATGDEADRLHNLAHDKHVTAKNLADETARAHELPTDRAYIEHTTRLGRDSYLHTLRQYAPSVFKRWEGVLQQAGYRSTDPELLARGMIKHLKAQHEMQIVQALDKRGVGPRDMTQRQAQEHMHAQGLNPRDWTILHLGQLRDSMLARHNNADPLQAPHFDTDPEVHARNMRDLLDQARNPSPTLKGARLFPKSAVDEMGSSFGKAASSLPARLFGRAKGSISKEMLGLNPSWAVQMGLGTYPLQMGLLAHTSPFSIPNAVRWWKGLDEAQKRVARIHFGIDDPFSASTHGIRDERMGAALPERLSNAIRVFQTSPFGKALKSARLDERILQLERVPRQYTRIASVYKGVRNEALRQMWKDMHGMNAEQGKLAAHWDQIKNLGKMPSADYLDRAMGHQPFAEAHAEHLNRALGEWHNFTSFERHVLNRTFMFYPWLRYSLKLAFHTLPVHHPLAYAIAGKLGQLEHDELVKLLGTEPQAGTMYFGQPQPQTPPEQRKWTAMGARDINPVMNAALDVLSSAGNPSQAVDTLPPYLSALVGWAVNKNLFTDKPLKGGGPGEAQGLLPGTRPQIVPYMLGQTAQSLWPSRVANQLATRGVPQAADSLFGSKPVQYGPTFTRQIAQEAAGRTTGQVLKETAFPFMPHRDTKLGIQIKSENKAAAVAGKKKGKTSAGGLFGNIPAGNVPAGNIPAGNVPAGNAP